MNNELTGAELDLCVAKAEGITGLVEKNGRMCRVEEWDPEKHSWADSLKDWAMWMDYAPSQRWDQGGPIIERERIAISCHAWGGGAYLDSVDELWNAKFLGGIPSAGPSPLIAAMRAYVAKTKASQEVEEK